MMMMLVVSVNAVTAVVVRPPSVVISAVIWIAPVIAVITSWIISIVPWVTVIADPDRNLSVSLFHRDQSESDCYQWK